jgi:hypothetical protein
MCPLDRDTYPGKGKILQSVKISQIYLYIRGYGSSKWSEALTDNTADFLPKANWQINHCSKTSKPVI